MCTKTIKLGLELWFLKQLSTIFEMYHGSQFYWWRKQEYPEKTTEMAVSFIGGGNRNTQSKPQKWQSVLLVEETGIPSGNNIA